VWPLPRQFPPDATPNCPARGSVPGAVAAAARVPARPQGQPDPIVASGEGGIRTWARRQAHLARLGDPRMGCGSMLFRAALRAEVRAVSAVAGQEPGPGPGPGARASRSRSSAARELFRPPSTLGRPHGLHPPRRV